MQKIAQKIAIFLKNAKNRGRDFPEGQNRSNTIRFLLNGELNFLQSYIMI